MGNHQARIRELVERTLLEDYFKEIDLAMESKWLTLTIIKGLS